MKFTLPVDFKAFFMLFLALGGAMAISAQDIDFSQWEQIKPRNVGPAGMSGRVTAIDVDLTDRDRIYVGTASGGVWLSENGGITWAPIFDDVPVLSIGAIKINPANTSEVWVGTGEGNPRNSQNSGAGVYRSLDKGKTWQFMGLKDTRVIHRILIDPTESGTVFVGAQGSQWGDSEDRGVYKTTDGGKTWDKVLYVNDKTGIGEMVMDPQNPKKIIAAMWEFYRRPWYSYSGGEGSGLYITYDGGENWTEITSEDGLPEGDLGRIGLTISASNNDIVYALVEAKENALYKSTDGGSKWTKISTDDLIGNRPFYYAEIYVDPHNPDRLYSLWSYVSRSEDGGKTWKVIADYGNNVHPDHHAFWIDPDDPSYVIDGNDGGMNFSEDYGDTWRFVANLPVGQFYHVDVDDDFPYNIYGGMQDNGSWVGPAFVPRSGGITNYDWQEVYFGDGFDVAPKPGDNRYVYAMSQGGNLGVVDKETGATKFLKPNNADTTQLRYNWNAALALEPENDCGIYYGSQFVHYSDDCGVSWDIISPDLTTNDTSKHHQDISGGLTIDATNAENNNCILSIAPSPVDPNVIWVGTDDGKLHVTTDKGKNWTDLSNRLPGAPEFGFIPQIEVNTLNAGVAWVVVNNYRLNDWSAYLYHTSDYGVTWRRVVDDSDVTSFVTSVVQDEEEPNLVFLGTDAGLYVSFDKGGEWQKWDQGFPAVQIRDMKIQKRHGDLVLGTFGRAFWVIDDLGPFRAFAKESFVGEDFKVLSASDGYLAERRSYQGIRFIGQAEYQGDNRGTGAMYSIWIKPDKKDEMKKKKGEKKEEEKKKGEEKGKKDKKNKLTFNIINSSGDTIRTFSRPVKEKGLIRTSWNLSTDGVRFPSRQEVKEDSDLPGGERVLPGEYTTVISYKDYKDSIKTVVHIDPRLELSESNRKAMLSSAEDYQEIISKATASFEKLMKAKKSMTLVEKLTETLSDTTKTFVGDLTKEEKKKIEELELLFFDKEGLKGIQRNPSTLSAQLRGAGRYIRSAYGAVGPNGQIAVDKATSETNKVTAKVEEYLSGDWKKYQAKINEVDFKIFDED